MRMLNWLALVLVFPMFSVAATPKVTAMRCPDGGIQPQAVVDAAGKIHLIYLKGEDAKSDVFYTTSTNGGQSWAKPLRVNSHPGAAIAVGTVRGAQISIGRNNRPHVAWMGSQDAEPKGSNGATPMLYTRLNDAGDAFEPQRNLITFAPGLDGGGSIAADPARGVVAVMWHAPTPGKRGEENRNVFMAVSSDDGKSFAPETPVLDGSTGVCGCCGMRSLWDSRGSLVTLYRAANSQSRDIYLSSLQLDGKRAQLPVHPWPTKTCPMSTAALALSGDRVVTSWETQGQVFLGSLDTRSDQTRDPAPAPGKGKNRKHPTLAVDKAGHVLLGWSEGTGWKRGGSVAWQVYGADLQPIAGARGTAENLPVWSLPTAVAAGDGAFLLVY